MKDPGRKIPAKFRMEEFIIGERYNVLFKISHFESE